MTASPLQKPQSGGEWGGSCVLAADVGGSRSGGDGGLVDVGRGRRGDQGQVSQAEGAAREDVEAAQGRRVAGEASQDVVLSAAPRRRVPARRRVTAAAGVQ